MNPKIITSNDSVVTDGITSIDVISSPESQAGVLKFLALAVGIAFMVVAVSLWDFITNPGRFLADLDEANGGKR
jgi:hypothetical protein